MQSSDPEVEGGQIVEDRLFGGALRLAQPARGHRAGTDAVLLAAMLPPEARRIADLGAASGVVGLRAAQMNPEAEVVLIEREPDLVRLAMGNIETNGLGHRVMAYSGDVLRLGAEQDLRERFDCVLTNPPYLDAARFRASNNTNRERAHMLEGSLSDWLRNAATILAPKGRLLLIHRADAASEILDAAGKRFGGLAFRFVHPVADQPAIRVLVAATKGSRAPLAILPPVILNDAGAFTPEVSALHQGRSRIDVKAGG